MLQEFLKFVGLLHCTTKHVILSGARSAESKNLRTFDAFEQIFGVKILRLRRTLYGFAQDDKPGGVRDKHQFMKKQAAISAACFLVQFVAAMLMGRMTLYSS